MTRNFGIVSLAAAAVILTLTPALAKTKPHHRAAPQTYDQPYAYQPAPYQSQFGSDPSWYSYNYQLDRSLGRCVEDLGYGRYEYCD